MSRRALRRRATVVTTVVCAVLLAACSGGPSKGRSTPAASGSSSGSTSGTASTGGATSATGFTPAPVDWRPCGDGSSLDCATVEVPIDYASPGGGTLGIAIDRIPAADPANRIGSLLVNPGGPGGSGVDFIKGGTSFDRAVRDRFDIVGFDPRGVGGSAPIQCATTSVDALRAVDAQPDSPAEQVQLDAAAKAVADDCGMNGGAVLAHLGTDDVVRDMESIRQAIGDDKLTYAGFSYGTLLGLRYLQLFPTNARAVYLDGVVDPTQDFVGFLTGQARAFEARLQAIFADCPAGGQGCPAGGAQAAYDEIAARVETAPLPARRGEVLDPTALATAAVYSTYVPSFATTFYKALSDGLGGDGSGLRAMADAYYGEGSFAVYAGVECIDSPHPVGAEAYKRFADDLVAISPRFGGAIANELLPCAYWPVPVQSVLGAVRAPDGPPTLVVGTTQDSATPYEQAVRVAKDLAHGRLLTFEGTGHSSYGASTCVAKLVATYLVDLELPAEATTCKR